jgi:predicted transcriptional regulator
MAPQKSADLLIREGLETLGISLLNEWDVLAFLYRHATSLTSASEISHLLGEDKADVSAALDHLESLGLIQRSRGSQGVRLYCISVPTDPVRSYCFTEVINLAEKREGRLLLRKHLSRPSVKQSTRARGLRLA